MKGPAMIGIAMVVRLGVKAFADVFSYVYSTVRWCLLSLKAGPGCIQLG